MHVRQIQIQPAVLIVVKKLDPHGAPGRLRKIGVSLVQETLAALIFIELVLALHVRDVKIHKPVTVDVTKGRVARPRRMLKIHFLGDILELKATHVLVEDALFVVLRIHEGHSDIRHANVVTAPPLFVGGVFSNIGDEQVEQTVVVEVKENCAGRVPDIIQPG